MNMESVGEMGLISHASASANANEGVKELDWNSESDEETQDSHALWMTEALREEMKRKSNLFWNAKRCSSSEAWEAFKLQRQRVGHLVREAKMKVGIPLKKTPKWSVPSAPQEHSIPESKVPYNTPAPQASPKLPSTKERLCLCLRCCDKFPYYELVAHYAEEHVHESLNNTALGNRVKGRKANTSPEFHQAMRMILQCSPIVGLDFITEYQIEHEHPFFICDLCHSIFRGAQTLLSHLTDSKHQCNYWKCMSIEDYVKFTSKGSPESEVHCSVAKLQDMYGSGAMNVQKGFVIPANESMQMKMYPERYPGVTEEYNNDGMTLKGSKGDLELNRRSQEPSAQDPYTIPRLEKLKKIESMLDFQITSASEESLANKLVRLLKNGLLHYKIQALPDELAKNLYGEVEVNLRRLSSSVDSQY